MSDINVNFEPYNFSATIEGWQQCGFEAGDTDQEIYWGSVTVNKTVAILVYKNSDYLFSVDTRECDGDSEIIAKVTEAIIEYESRNLPAEE